MTVKSFRVRRRVLPRSSLLQLIVFAGLLPALPMIACAASSHQPAPCILKAPAQLRCEYLLNPIGIDMARPRLFWQDSSAVRDAVQSAWQIRVRCRESFSWDSGKVASPETIQVEYAGPALKPDTLYTWRVRVWDGSDRASAWSEPAHFTTGLQPDDWGAQWIARRPEKEWKQRWDALRAEDAKRKDFWANCNDSMEWYRGHNPPYDAAPLLRKVFTLDKPVKAARLFITGLGNYHLFVNGQRMDGGVIAPGITNYSKRVLYNGYDVQAALKPGVNALGIELGRGWYSLIGYEVWGFDHAPWIAQPKTLLHLSIEFTDGTHQTVVSDGTWKTVDGPLVFDDFRRGEVYDATRERPGWNTARFNDAGWDAAVVVPAPAGALQAELMEPMRATARFNPIKITSPPETAVDVTGRVKAAVHGHQLSIPANNSMFGDPAPYKVKALRVEYSVDGVNKTAEAPENGTLEVDGGDRPLVILNARYGALTLGRQWLFEFPQNVAGRAVFRLNGTGMRGKTVKLTYYPFRSAKGELGMNSWGQTQYYTCKGEPLETMESHFAYYGATYVLAEGLAHEPKLTDMTLEEVRSAVEDAGTFETSNPLLNRVQSNIRWTQSSALHSYPQDCWTRERLGWTGDAHLTSEEAIFNYGMASLYTKYAQDHRDSQGKDGGIPAFVPNFQTGNESVTWSGSCIIIPWELYRYYGDRRILEEHFETGERYLAAASHAGNQPWVFFGGPADWCPPRAKTADQIPDDPELGVDVATFPADPEGTLVYGTAYYYRLARIMAQMARILGKNEAALKYEQQASEVFKAFNSTFFDSAAGVYHGDAPSDYRQAANALALWLGLVPADRQEEVLQNLDGDIRARWSGALNTGILGTQALFEELPEAGRADIAYEMAARTEYPGYIWPILRFGLTTLPEQWEGFGTHEHPMFASVGAFFYKWLAGIQPDETAPAFHRFRIHPSIDNPLQFVRACYQSIRGPIAVTWHKEGAALALNVEIPANTRAEVFVPKYGYAHPVVTESGHAAPGGDDAGDAVKFVRGSGHYAFRVTSSEPLAAGRRAGIRIAAADLVLTPGEPGELHFKVEGAIAGSKLAARPGAGIVPGAIRPNGAGGFIMKVTLAPGQRTWRALELPLRLTGLVGGRPVAAETVARLLVRPAVEIRYTAPLILSAPGYDSTVPLFTLHNTHTRMARFMLSPQLPDGWGIQFRDRDGKPLALPIQLESGVRLRVAAALTAPAVGGSAVSPLKVSVLEEGKAVGEVVIPLEETPAAESQFEDDFQSFSWTPEPDLKAEIRDGKFNLTQPPGTRSMLSRPITLDFSKPQELAVDIRSLGPRTLWAIYVQDEHGFYRGILGDNSAIGVTRRGLDDLGWSGLHRFRLKFYLIGESAEIGSVRIQPRR